MKLKKPLMDVLLNIGYTEAYLEPKAKRRKSAPS